VVIDRGLNQGLHQSDALLLGEHLPQRLELGEGFGEVGFVDSVGVQPTQLVADFGQPLIDTTDERLRLRQLLRDTGQRFPGHCNRCDEAFDLVTFVLPLTQEPSLLFLKAWPLCLLLADGFVKDLCRQLRILTDAFDLCNDELLDLLRWQRRRVADLAPLLLAGGADVIAAGGSWFIAGDVPSGPAAARRRPIRRHGPTFGDSFKCRRSVRAIAVNISPDLDPGRIRGAAAPGGSGLCGFPGCGESTAARTDSFDRQIKTALPPDGLFIRGKRPTAETRSVTTESIAGCLCPSGGIQGPDTVRFNSTVQGSLRKLGSIPPVAG